MARGVVAGHRVAGFVVMLRASSAFASGREGEALVTPIRWIVGIVLVAFVALVFGGGLLGAIKASRAGESIVTGGARGLRKGLIAFLIVSAVSVAIVTLLGFLWIAYAFLTVDTITPS